MAAIRPEVEEPIQGAQPTPAERCARLREDVARLAATPRGEALDPVAIVATEDGLLGLGPDATSA